MIKVVSGTKILYFPLSQCKKPLALEFGLKQQSIRMKKEKDNVKNVFKYLAEHNIQCDNLSTANFHSVFALDQAPGKSHLPINDCTKDL
jgi:hypothetical protein